MPAPAHIPKPHAASGFLISNMTLGHCEHAGRQCVRCFMAPSSHWPWGLLSHQGYTLLPGGLSHQQGGDRRTVRQPPSNSVHTDHPSLTPGHLTGSIHPGQRINDPVQCEGQGDGSALEEQFVTVVHEYNKKQTDSDAMSLLPLRPLQTTWCHSSALP